MTEWVTLHLTSPHMTDKRVHHMGGSEHQVTYAQNLLRSHANALHCDPGTADGDFGVHSAQATEHAKWFLGFPRRKVNRWFNNDLALYLNGGKKLGPNYRLRKKLRARAWKKAHENPKRVKAANLMLSKKGVHESPYGSNRVEFSYWYGFIGPWCAMFVTWAGVQVGQKSFVRGQRYAYVPNLTFDAEYGHNGLGVTHDPQYGDVVVYHWPGGEPQGDHTGRFLHWIIKGYSFTSVEGNTSDTDAGSQDNGGIVAVRTRYVSNVVRFVRVHE